MLGNKARIDMNVAIMNPLHVYVITDYQKVFLTTNLLFPGENDFFF